MQVVAKNFVERAAGQHTRSHRVGEVFAFIIKKALTGVLPPKQRKIFYSVWVRSRGSMKHGIMELSRRTGQSHYTSYNNYYKAVHSIQVWLDKSGYAEHIIDYLNGGTDTL